MIKDYIEGENETDPFLAVVAKELQNLKLLEIVSFTRKYSPTVRINTYRVVKKSPRGTIGEMKLLTMESAIEVMKLTKKYDMDEILLKEGESSNFLITNSIETVSLEEVKKLAKQYNLELNHLRGKIAAQNLGL